MGIFSQDGRPEKVRLPTRGPTQEDLGADAQTRREGSRPLGVRVRLG